MYKNRTWKLVILVLSFTGLIVSMGYFKWDHDRNNPITVSYTSFKSSRYFAKQSTGEKFAIKQKIYDYKNNEIPISYNISKNAYNKAKDEYGIDFKECCEFAITSMQKYINIQKQKYGLIFNINFTYNNTGAIAWKYNYKYRDNTDLQRINKLLSQIKSQIPIYQHKCYKKYGFYVKNNMIYPDFAWLNKRNSNNLHGLFMSMYKEAKKRNYGQIDFLGMVLGFCQEIPYVIPPNVENNKLIIGLYPPTQTVVENRGDCDCKSALFASLWGLYSKGQVVLVRVPGHIFAAIKGRRTFSTDSMIRYAGDSYICMEPVGPGKLPLGRVSALSYGHLRAGNFEVHEIH